MITAPTADHREAAAHLRPFLFRSLALTHPGCVRKVNEDACLDRPHIGLWAVADGMGGHNAGDIASETVVDRLSGVRNFSSAFVFRRDVRAALLNANSALRFIAANESVDVIGSTVVTLIAHAGHYACIWAGDSRAYVLRQGRLEQITRDHSVVQELVDAGSLDALHARNHRQAHVITRAVGAAEHLDLESVHGRIEADDRFLLCSDGLGVLTDAEIGDCLRSPSLAGAANALLLATIERGAPDNLTCVIIDAHQSAIVSAV